MNSCLGNDKLSMLFVEMNRPNGGSSKRREREIMVAAVTSDDGLGYLYLQSIKFSTRH